MSADTQSYDELYSAAWAHVPEEKVLPVGHWLLKATGIYYNPAKTNDAGKEISPRFSCRYTPVKPDGDVRPADLKALGDYDWTDNEIYNKGGSGNDFYWGNRRDKRRFLEHLQKHTGFTFKEVPLIVKAEDGSERVNPEVAEAFRGATVLAKLEIDEYKGQSRNVATDFISAQG